MTLSAGMKRAGAALGTGALLLALAACGNNSGSDEGGSESGSASSSASALSGQLAGAGASSQESAMEAWKAGFNEKQPDVSLSYDAVGSGAGVQQFTSGQVAWAGSDAYLASDDQSAAEKRCGGPAWDLPVYVSPIAIIFNLKGVDSLNLDPDTLAGIFHGDITTWNDPKIKATNPDADLPSTKITPVHRSDKSGTTKNFTDYLHAAAPKAWTDAAAEEWPVSGGESGAQTSGLVQAVQGGDGTIGYADASKAGNLGTVKVKVGSEWVGPTNEGAAKAAETAKPASGRDANDLALDVDRTTTESGAYPVILISYSIVCSKYDDANTAALVKAFITYQASSDGQQTASENAGSAPLSDALSKKVTDAANQIQG